MYLACGVIVTSKFSSPFLISTSNSSPAHSTWSTSLQYVIGVLLIFTMMSLSCRPTLLAGLPGDTLVRSTPLCTSIGRLHTWYCHVAIIFPLILGQSNILILYVKMGEIKSEGLTLWPSYMHAVDGRTLIVLGLVLLNMMCCLYWESSVGNALHVYLMYYHLLMSVIVTLMSYLSIMTMMIQ